MKSSSLSFSKLSRNQYMRYVKLAGCPDTTFGGTPLPVDAGEGILAGITTWWERWLEKRSSEPPPNSILTLRVDITVSERLNEREEGGDALWALVK